MIFCILLYFFGDFGFFGDFLVIFCIFWWFGDDSNGDGDSVGDGDSDGDGDSNSDSDSDGDGDSDGDSDDGDIGMLMVMGL